MCYNSYMSKKVLYLIQHKGLPQYTKIGFSTDLSKRVRQLQTASPTGVVVLWSIESPKAEVLEAYLHRRWAFKQTNLEWFALSEQDIQDIIDDVSEKMQKYLDKNKQAVYNNN